MNDPTEARIIEAAPGSFSRKEERALPAVVDATPMSMLAVAVQRGMDPDTIASLLALQKEWEANEARKAFNEAFAAFKKDPPVLTKNRHVSYPNSKGGNTDYWHATLDQVAVEIGKKLGEHGLSFRWNTEQQTGGMIRVTCLLEHSRGHKESVWLESGRDESGGKNNIQALGSTVTYLQRYTLLAITGLAAKDQDDDGRGAEGRKEVEPDPAGKKALEEAGTRKAFVAAWNALTIEQRKTLLEVKEACLAKIKEAEQAEKAQR